MAKLCMAHASTHGARKPPGPKRKREKERLNYGNCKCHLRWRTQSRLGQKEERKWVITMASYALQRHLEWRTQSRLGQKTVDENNGQLRFVRHPPSLLDHFQSNMMLIFGPGGFACATLGGVAMRSWPLLLPSFTLLFLSFTSFAFDPLRGKFVSPNILAQAACVRHA